MKVKEHNSPIIQELLNEVTPEEMKATEQQMELIAFSFFILNHYGIKEDDGYHYVNSMGEHTTVHKLIQHYLEDNKPQMTVKEKAHKLISKFYYSLPNNGYISDGLLSCDNRWKEGTDMAIIAVDMIIEALDAHQWQNRHEIDSWKEIKQELEK